MIIQKQYNKFNKFLFGILLFLIQKNYSADLQDTFNNLSDIVTFDDVDFTNFKRDYDFSDFKQDCLQLNEIQEQNNYNKIQREKSITKKRKQLIKLTSNKDNFEISHLDCKEKLKQLYKKIISKYIKDVNNHENDKFIRASLLKEYICLICNCFSTGGLMHVMKHVEKHNKLSDNICPICEVCFQTPETLKTHIRNHYVKLKKLEELKD